MGDFLAGLYTGEPEGIKRSLKKLVEKGATKFHPAHGESMWTANIFKIFTGDK